MKLINYNPVKTNYSSSDTLLDKFLNNEVDYPKSRFIPAVDIFEEKNFYEIQLSVPGLNKDSFLIDLNEGKLNVSGERKIEEKSGKAYLSIESQYGNFSRSFLLSEDIDADEIEASYQNGILILKLPKIEKFLKKIQIKVK